MSFGFSDLELKSSQGLVDRQSRWIGVMEGGARRRTLVDGKPANYKPLSRVNSRSIFLSYFSIESFLALVFLTASLLILPVILPPLPPPPFMLLLLPIGLLVVLLILAFMPSDVRDIASSYV